MFGSQGRSRRIKAVATLVAEGTEVQGDIKFSGELIVEGRVTGHIVADDESDAVVRVATQGHIEGSINVPTVIIHGAVKGDVRASRHIELTTGALINGTVYYESLEMMTGAHVNGNLVNDTSAGPAHRALSYRAGGTSSGSEIVD